MSKIEKYEKFVESINENNTESDMYHILKLREDVNNGEITMEELSSELNNLEKTSLIAHIINDFFSRKEYFNK